MQVDIKLQNYQTTIRSLPKMVIKHILESSWQLPSGAFYIPCCLFYATFAFLAFLHLPSWVPCQPCVSILVPPCIMRLSNSSFFLPQTVLAVSKPPHILFNPLRRLQNCFSRPIIYTCLSLHFWFPSCKWKRFSSKS